MQKHLAVDDGLDATQRTTTPLISIITPSLHQAAYIRQTIDSVLAQDYPAVEHIVVDGGSTDGTVTILREYERRYPTRFRWLSEPDNGQAHAINKGIAMARGVFIGWQNSDDYYLPNVFARPIAYLVAHPDVALVYGDCRVVDERDRLLSVNRVFPFNYEMLLQGSVVPNQAAFLRRDILLRYGGVAEGLTYAMDMDLLLRLGLRERIAYLPGVIGAFRVRPTAKTYRDAVQGIAYGSLREVVLVFQRTLANPLLTAAQRDLGTGTLARTLYLLLIDASVRQYEADALRWLRQIRDIDLTFMGWPFFVTSLAEWLLNHDDHRDDGLIPLRVLAAFRQSGLDGTPQARTLLAAHHLSKALDPQEAPTRLVALQHVLRAMAASRRDRGFFRQYSVGMLVAAALLDRRTVRLLQALTGHRPGIGSHVAA